MPKSKTTKKRGTYWHSGLAERWKIYDSPVRPSKSECQLIKHFISHHRKPIKILILGATPEFRDVAHGVAKKEKSEITCADISLDMIIAMAELMKYSKQTQQEIWLKANWLALPLAKNYYDYVLGDLVIGNIPIDLQPKLLAQVKEVLKPGGFFITRCYWPITPPESAEEVIERILRKSNWTKKQINLFTWGIFHSVYRNEKQSITTTTDDMRLAIKKVLKKTSDKKKKQLIAKLLRICLERYPPGKKWWTLSKRDAEAMAKKYFKITAIKHGTDYPYTFHCPLYFFKK